MKVALVAPPYPLEEAPSPPLGICYIASSLEAMGAEVILIDYIVSRYSREKLTKELESFRPDIVGVTSVTMNFPQAVDIVKTTKAYDPSIITMMGGPHVSFDAMSTLIKYPEIDIIVMGEGERTVMELMQCIREKDSWNKVDGIAFKKDGQVVITRPRELIRDLDSLPMPDRDILPVSRYLALGFPVSITTSRGCPYQCIFCVGRRMVGNRIRVRTAPHVADEIEQILSYGFPRINIADDLFTANRKWVTELCTEIKKRGLKFSWSAFARVNTVDRELLETMREAGCDTVSFGIESGNPEMLKRIKKGITLEHARKAVKACKEAGITAHASFIVGLPGETRETLRETSEFAESLDIAYGYHFLAPFPGTTVRDEIDRFDLEILTDDWSRYDANSAIVRTSSLSPEEINEFVAEFERKNQKEWEETEKRCSQGECGPDEYLRVEGYKKMQLVYRILSEDLIEGHSTFPMEEIQGQSPVKLLSQKIAGITGMDQSTVERTVGLFVDNGYIRSRKAGNKLVWYWTHNKKSESGPRSKAAC